MTENIMNETFLQVFLFETDQLIEQLEQIILVVEASTIYSREEINQIFRIMHTIKGSSAMMQLHPIAALTHSMEDLFAYLRANESKSADYSRLTDRILEGIDFIKEETTKLANGRIADGDASKLIEHFQSFLLELQGKTDSSEASIVVKHSYQATIYFQEGCEMENIRAYNVIHHLEDIAEDLRYTPADLFNSEQSLQDIRQQGFQMTFKSNWMLDKVQQHLQETIYLNRLEVVELDPETSSSMYEALKQHKDANDAHEGIAHKEQLANASSTMISVNVSKLDKLLDLVAEIVIAESMVTQNPDLQGLPLENFQKASRQLHKSIDELQDSVLSLRMVSLSTTFAKMNRLVRDMKKKLNKEIQLVIIGEETEVDKNIIEHLSDPLMHLVRNSVDHGIETIEERMLAEKPNLGTITLEAKSTGSDVLILVRDDGKGLNKEGIMKKAREKGLLPAAGGDYTDRELFNLILQPGFSTKESVTEFSGRGVGMDVAVKNIEALGGEISVESKEGLGTTVTIRIPLTLAIIDGMNIRVGPARYTIPIAAIKESFRPKTSDLITDPYRNEWIMVRGDCLKVIRLSSLFNMDSTVRQIDEGIMIMVEEKNRYLCIFADELLGEQQVVVKSLPAFVKNIKKIGGISGCTLLGDGSISLILDFADLCPSAS